MSNGQWRQLARRALPGLVGGGIGGCLGGLVGNFLLDIGLTRAIGWIIMGLAIGVVEGLYERNFRKIRNGLLGGGLGGLLGGLLFDPILSWTATDSGMSSRATAFVVLGLCVGASTGLAQVVLRDAWLTVVDGYRTGRQLNLTRAVTVLGRSDCLPLPFLGPMNKDLEPEHLRIIRRLDGSYVVEDNRSKLGTRLNNQPLDGPTGLKDGDVIRLGTNLVRFNERRRRLGGQPGAAIPQAVEPAPSPPPPPMVRRPAAETFSQVVAPPLPPPAPPVSPGIPARPRIIPPPPPERS